MDTNRGVCDDPRSTYDVVDNLPWRICPLVSWWDVKDFEGTKLYIIGVLLRAVKNEELEPLVAQAVLSEDRRTTIEMTLRFVETECSRCGLVDSAAAVSQCRNYLLDIRHFQVTKEQAIGRIEELDRAIQRELKRHLFLYIAPDKEHWYRTPAEGWEEVIKRWDHVRDDIVEASKCFACDRYAAAVFHVILVAEAGAIEVGKLIEITDPKPGWNSVLREMDRILHRAKFPDLKPSEQEHYKLLEQLWPLMQGMKDAWRHKISHVENKLVLMTGDFSPQIAEDVIVATRAFMRRLVIDLPVSENP
jgi:hypothetical protein